jgi:hypothetical protein
METVPPRSTSAGLTVGVRIGAVFCWINHDDAYAAKAIPIGEREGPAESMIPPFKMACAGSMLRTPWNRAPLTPSTTASHSALVSQTSRSLLRADPLQLTGQDSVYRAY